MKSAVIELNPDKKVVEEVKQKVKDNHGYCPCALIKNKDTLCMCKDFRMQEEGFCHCGMYYKKKVNV